MSDQLNMVLELSKDLWVKQGQEFVHASESLDGLISMKAEFSSKTPRSLTEIMYALDETIMWIISVSLGFQSIVLETKLSSKKEKVFMSMTSACVSQTLSIRQLVLSGFDLSAKQSSFYQLKKI